MTKIFTDARLLGMTLPESIRAANELGIGLMVSLANAESAGVLLALRDDRVQYDWDQPFDELRGRAIEGPELTWRPMADHGLTVERPMLLYELLRRHMESPRWEPVLLYGGHANLVEQIAATLQRGAFMPRRVVYMTADAQTAQEAFTREIPLLWSPPIQSSLHELLQQRDKDGPPSGGLLVPSHLLSAYGGNLKDMVTALQTRWWLCVDCRRDPVEETCQWLGNLKQAGVTALLVNDPVLALYA